GVSGADMRPWSVALRTLAAAADALVAVAPPARLRGVHRDARAYVALVALWSLRPFLPETFAGALAKLTLDALVPLRALAGLWSLHSVADVAIGFCLYLPIGAWLAVHPRADGGRRAPWAGLALAAATELAQLVVRGRSADVTDVLVQGAGVLVGWAIVLRADARRARLAGRGQSALGYVSGGSDGSSAPSRSSGATARVASKW
ncbi:VanZ family protein, partial [Roseisolibacter sp. H3M3-2]|uniref:VanZ family protein n=1 Tax=Roseisolibacter sp. H3M3-2 TaxID=3031323 RepID=UPI0023DA9E11